MYEKILVPIDGSEPSEQALAEAIALARSNKGQIRLLHVIDELSFVLGAGFGVASAGYGGRHRDEIISLLEESGKKLLAESQARVQEAGVECTTVCSDTFHGRLAAQVSGQAKAWPAQLIVLGSHGRRGLDRLFLGSDAEQILREAPVPVLLVRAAPSR